MNRRSALSLALYVIAVAVILLVTYPLTDTNRYGLLTKGQLIAVYAEMTGCISMLGIVTWLLLDRAIRCGVYLKAVLAFFATTFLLGGYGLLMFHASPAWKGHAFLGDMQTLFFGDYMGLKFSWVTGPLCSLLVAVMIVVNPKKNESSDEGRA
jgi:hypothetical protein